MDTKDAADTADVGEWEVGSVTALDSTADSASDTADSAADTADMATDGVDEIESVIETEDIADAEVLVDSTSPQLIGGVTSIQRGVVSVTMLVVGVVSIGVTTVAGDPSSDGESETKLSELDVATPTFCSGGALT